MPIKSLELKHTISMIQMMNDDIAEVEVEIKKIIDKLHSPLLSILGIIYNPGAIILAEVGDFSPFSNPDKVLAYARCSPIWT